MFEDNASMKIAAATDFAGSTGDPDLSLRALAEAGFTSLHWCHHWCDDFLYDAFSATERKAILYTELRTGKSAYGNRSGGNHSGG